MTAQSVLRWLCALLVASVTATHAHAAPETASSPERERALELAREGKSHYQAGRLDRAAELLERAYAIHPEPVLQFNLAKAYEGLGEFGRAIVAYERYLATAAEIEDRPAIEARVRSLKRELEERRALQRQRDEEREKARRARGKTRVVVEKVTEPQSPWPWVTTGVGATAAVTGVVFWAIAKSNYDSAGDGSAKDGARRVDTAQSLARWGNVLVVSGSVIAAAGLTWVVLDSRASATGARLRISPGAVSAEARF